MAVNKCCARPNETLNLRKLSGHGCFILKSSPQSLYISEYFLDGDLHESGHSSKSSVHMLKSSFEGFSCTRNICTKPP